MTEEWSGIIRNRIEFLVSKGKIEHTIFEVLLWKKDKSILLISLKNFKGSEIYPTCKLTS